MYEIELVGKEYTTRVDAAEIEICDRLDYAPNVRLVKEGMIVFFAPFDSIISIRKVELCKGQTTTN